jgi:hypothetical protein
MPSSVGSNRRTIDPLLLAMTGVLAHLPETRRSGPAVRDGERRVRTWLATDRSFQYTEWRRHYDLRKLRAP